MDDTLMKLLGGGAISLALLILIYPYATNWGGIPGGTHTSDVRACKVSYNGAICQKVGGYTYLCEPQTVGTASWSGGYVQAGNIAQNLQITSSKDSGTTESLQVDLLAPNSQVIGTGICYIGGFQFGNPLPQTQSCTVTFAGIASGESYTFNIHGRLAQGGEMAFSPATRPSQVNC